MTRNRIFELLRDLGIIEESLVAPFWPRVRDREDVAALRCGRSGVIFLSRTDHIHPEHYSRKQSLEFWSAADRTSALRAVETDTLRRAAQFGPLIAGKKWLDVGTGLGGLLDALGARSESAAAIEPQPAPRAALGELGYRVAGRIEEISDDDFAVVTLFHVFEHLLEPLESLVAIRRRMRPGGTIVLEVPHAGDFLLTVADLPAFKDFTLWSEHLVLHTAASIRAFLEAAGFERISVEGFQRYPLSNHLYWLRNGKPGGHLTWNQLETPALSRAYAEMLSGIGATDTLIATARNPSL